MSNSSVKNFDSLIRNLLSIIFQKGLIIVIGLKSILLGILGCFLFKGISLQQ